MANKNRARPQSSGSAPVAVASAQPQVPGIIRAPSPTPHELVKTQIGPRLVVLEQVVGYKVITYFLDQGSALADEQVVHLYEHLRRLGHQKDLGLWLCSRGGATETPLKIVNLIREFADRFRVLIPYRAHSAATLIACGADEIVMTEMAELGPVDPSRRHPLLPREEGGEQIPISVQDLRHVLKFLEREMGKDLSSEAAATVYTVLFEKVHPLAIGALEQSWALARQICEQVLCTHLDSEKDRVAIDAIVDRLSDHYKSHLYQISRHEARAIGLKVKDASAAESVAMWDLYQAYAAIQLQGEGQLGKEPILVVGRLGHLDSTAGGTLGTAIAKRSEPAKVIAATWESVWDEAPVAAPPAAAAAAPP